MNLEQCNGNYMLSEGYAPSFDKEDIQECSFCNRPYSLYYGTIEYFWKIDKFVCNECQEFFLV